MMVMSQHVDVAFVVVETLKKRLRRLSCYEDRVIGALLRRMSKVLEAVVDGGCYC